MIITMKASGNPTLDQERRLAFQGLREITQQAWEREFGPMTYEAFCAEYGSPAERRASLVAQYPQYCEDEDEAWARMDAENEAGARGQVAKGRY